MYTKSIDNEYVNISLYVDDMFVFSTSMNVVYNTKYFLAFKFDMKDKSEVSVILGIKIIWKDNGIMLTQEHYVEKLLKKSSRFDMTYVSTFYDVNSQLKK